MVGDPHGRPWSRKLMSNCIEIPVKVAVVDDLDAVTSGSGRSCAESISHWSAEHVAPSSEDDVERQLGIDRGRGGGRVTTGQIGNTSVAGNRGCIYILLGEVENREQFLYVTDHCIDDMCRTMVGSGCTTIRLGGVGEQEAHQRRLESVGCRGAVWV